MPERLKLLGVLSKLLPAAAVHQLIDLQVCRHQLLAQIHHHVSVDPARQRRVGPEQLRQRDSVHCP